MRLTGAFILDWGVCSNPDSRFDARARFEHDGCEVYAEASDGWGNGYPVRREQAWEWFCTRMGGTVGALLEALRVGDDARVAGLANYAARAARIMVLRMSRHGVLGDIPPPPLPETPAGLLDTDAVRSLVDELRRAYIAAIEVDRERGWYPNGLAETIGDILALAELDIQSAANPAASGGQADGEP